MKYTVVLLFVLMCRCQSSVLNEQISAEEFMKSMFGDDQNMKDSLQEKLHKMFELEKKVGLRRNDSVARKLIKPVLEGDILMSHSMIDKILAHLERMWVKNIYGRGFKSFFMGEFCPRHQKNITFYFNDTNPTLKEKDIADIKAEILVAMSIYENNTCLKFHEVPPENFDDARMIFQTSDPGCVTLTMCEIPTIINFAISCIHWTESPGTAWHEIGHALGFVHEQAREDRDEYIDIDVDNVPDDLIGNYLGCAQFSPLGCPSDTPYDFGSLLHYGTSIYSESHNRNVVFMTPKWKYRHYNHTMGVGNKGPSFYDTKEVNDVYCKNTCTHKERSCINGGYQNPANCDECLCPLGYSGKDCSKIEPSSPGCGNMLSARGEWQLLKTPGNTSAKIVQDLHCVWQIRTIDEAHTGFRATNYLCLINFICLAIYFM